MGGIPVDACTICSVTAPPSLDRSRVRALKYLYFQLHLAEPMQLIYELHSDLFATWPRRRQHEIQGLLLLTSEEIVCLRPSRPDHHFCVHDYDDLNGLFPRRERDRHAFKTFWDITLNARLQNVGLAYIEGLRNVMILKACSRIS